MIEKERVMSIAKQRRSEGEGWWDRMDLLVSSRCSSWGNRGRIAGKLSPLRLIFSASGSSVDLFVWAMVTCGAMHATAMSFPFPRCYLAAGSTFQLRGEVQTLEHMDVQQDLDQVKGSI